VVVCNVQTAFAVHEAVCEGRPLLDRVVTVDGDAIAKPGNYRIAIGTSVRHVLRACEADLDRASIVLAGGPMMGRRVGLDATIEPGTSAVLALDDSQHSRVESTPCIRCARCLEACPIDLPAGLLADDPDDRVADCIECGICQFVCVANRPLVDELRQAKRTIAEAEGDDS
jgi:electron transport complex protein RnfC